jgi:glycosyltransferase involved in cell wall biosynthesis
VKISVCMATYNGSKYINKQIESILVQLGEFDELIISDDSSSDNTVNLIKNFNDNRIKLYLNQKFKSPIYNFENAIKKANGDVVVLSDQDDIWKFDKIEIIKNNFDINKITLKMYNGNCINNNGNIIKDNLFDYLKINKGLLSNIKKNSFIGCNIAFSRKLLNIILPFPEDIPMHDIWIGSCAYLLGEVEFVDKKVLSYRLHDNNFTGQKTSLMQKIKWRFKLIKNLIKRYLYVKYSN